MQCFQFVAPSFEFFPVECESALKRSQLLSPGKPAQLLDPLFYCLQLGFQNSCNKQRTPVTLNYTVPFPFLPRTKNHQDNVRSHRLYNSVAPPIAGSLQIVQRWHVSTTSKRHSLVKKPFSLEFKTNNLKASFRYRRRRKADFISAFANSAP